MSERQIPFLRQGLSVPTLTVKTASVEPNQVTLKECAFVGGTSTDKGITIHATTVSLSPPTNGSCTTPQRTPRAPS